MRDKKKIRGKEYRIPRKLKKELKKQGLSTIWLEPEAYYRLLELAASLNTTPVEALTYVVREYIK